jgi:hypothetical protein
MARGHKKKRKRSSQAHLPGELFRPWDAPLTADDLAALEAVVQSVKTLKPKQIGYLVHVLENEVMLIDAFKAGTLLKVSDYRDMRKQERNVRWIDKATRESLNTLVDKGLAQYGEPFLYKVAETIGIPHKPRLEQYLKAVPVPSIKEVGKHHAYARGTRIQYEAAVKEHNERAAKIKSGLFSPPGDVVGTYEITPTEGPLPKEKQHAQPKQPLRDRRGYKPPTRAKTVSIQAFVEPDVREKFNGLAAAAGVSATDLLRHLVENAVTNGTDPSVQAAIADENRRAEEARNRLLATITPGKRRKAATPS